MKKIVLLLSIICLAATASWSAEDEHQFIPIRVLDNTIETGRTHRSSTDIPIVACYDDFISSICLQFLHNIGDVDVIITNAFTGDYIEYEVDSSLGSVMLPINGDVGIYDITILLSDGSGFEGEFEIGLN